MEMNGHNFQRLMFTEDMVCTDCGAVYGPDPACDLACPGEPIWDDPQG